MTRLLTVFAALFTTLSFADVATAQIAPYRSGVTSLDRHRYQGDRHRQQMETQRIDAQQRDLTARQMRIEAQLESQALRARRQPAVIPKTEAPLLGTPEREAAARRSATERRQALSEGVGQIDDWLSRPGG